MWNVGRIVGFASMLALFFAMASEDVFAQKKKKDADKDKYPAATEADYGSMQKNVIGKLTAVDGGGKSLSIRIEYSHLEANPKYKPPTGNPKSLQGNQQFQLWKAYNDLQVQMQKVPRNPKEAMQIQQRIAQDMARIQQQAAAQMYVAGAAAAKANGDPNNQPFVTVTNTKDFDLDIEEKAVFRKMFLSLDYDDMGSPKKYTDEEKIALRGDDKTKPGYSAKIDEATPGTEVKLYLTIPKKKAKDKEKAKDKDAEVPEDPPEHPTVRMIVLTKEAPATTSPGDEKKKKKDKN
jgi:hypothetical protein